MRKEEKHLADEFFQKTKDQAVDFEIALAALLATACLAYPIPSHPWISQIAAFGLLSVTLLRRIAIASPFAPESKIMSSTIPIIEFFTTGTIISLFLVLSRRLSPKLDMLSLIETFSIITMGIFLFLAVLQELTFRDYFVWWTAKFQERGEEGDILEKFWKEMELISYWLSTARRNRSSWNRIPPNIKNGLPDLTDFELDPVEHSKLVVRTLLILGLLYVIPLGYSIFMVGLPGILVVGAVVAIHDHSCFWYVAYGNTAYEEFRKPIPEIIFWTIVYTTVVAFLANPPSITNLLPL